MASLTKSIRITSQGFTTPIGFGTATLARLDAPSEIGQVIADAYDAGIRHFDTARLYGHGTMEGHIGRALQRQRQDVTIATKFGLESGLPGFISAKWLGQIKRIVKKTGVLRRRATALARRSTTCAYSPAAARRSLENSLRELSTDYLDVLFIHEGSPEEISHEGLLEFLQEEKQSGRIRAFGLAAQRGTVERVSPSVIEKFDILQFEADPITHRTEKIRQTFTGLIITHSVFALLEPILGFLTKFPRIRNDWSTQFSSDLGDRAVLVRLLWLAALRDNPSGIKLFSTTNRAHLLSNLRADDTASDDKALNQFVQFVSETGLTNAADV